jgi:hypothetical protein
MSPLMRAKAVGFDGGRTPFRTVHALRAQQQHHQYLARYIVMP